MEKRFVGRSSASLADGRVVFPGDMVDMSERDWKANSHLEAQFISSDDARRAAELETEPEDNKPVPEPAQKSKSNSKREPKE